MVNRFKDRIGRSSILKRLFNLSLLSLVSVFINFSIIPILTRIFGSEKFGELGYFLSWVNILAMIFSWRYEASIVSEDDDYSAEFLGFSSYLLSILTFLGVCLLYGVTFVLGFKIYQYALLAIFVGFIVNLGTISSNILNRKESTSTIGRSLIVRSFSSNLTQFLLGVYQWTSALSLIIGRLIGEVLTSAYLIINVFRKVNRPSFESVAKVKSALYEKIDFPKYTLPATLSNRFREELPVILLIAYFDPIVTGYYVVAKRLFSPIKFLTNSMKLLFYQEFSKKGLKLKIKIRLLYSFPVCIMLLLAVPSIIIYFVGPSSITIYLGSEWADSFDYLLLLLPGLVVKNAISTVGDAVFSLDKNRFGFIWSLAFLVGVSLAFYLGYSQDNAKIAYLGLSVVQIIMYLMYLVIIHIYTINGGAESISSYTN